MRYKFEVVSSVYKSCWYNTNRDEVALLIRLIGNFTYLEPALTYLKIGTDNNPYFVSEDNFELIKYLYE